MEEEIKFETMRFYNNLPIVLIRMTNAKLRTRIVIALHLIFKPKYMYRTMCQMVKEDVKKVKNARRRD